MDECGTSGTAVWRRRFAVLLPVAALAFLLLAVPAPAQAHTDLVSSSPAENALVPLATDRLVLVFSEDVVPVGSQVVVRDRSGVEVTLGAPGRAGNSLVVRLHLVEPGRHVVSYRVVGADGHPVTGGYTFRAVAAGVAGEPVVSALDRTVPAPVDAGVRQGAAARWLLPASGMALVLIVLHTLSWRLRRAGPRA